MNGPFRILALTALLSTSLAAGAQTCNADIDLTRPDSRYSDNGDGTVTDTATGLMWKQCPEGYSGAACGTATGDPTTYTWQEALARAQTVNGSGFADHSDWRLPNLKELKSLSETACYEPAINTTYFPGTPSSGFWSSSPNASNSSSAWYVGFYFGDGSWYGKSNTGRVRLVRAGQ